MQNLHWYKFHGIYTDIYSLFLKLLNICHRANILLHHDKEVHFGHVNLDKWNPVYIVGCTCNQSVAKMACFITLLITSIIQHENKKNKLFEAS